jgi:hypothetical protein
VVPLAHKPWCQPVSVGWDQTEEEMGPRVAEDNISFLKSDICFCVILPNFKLTTLAKSNVAFSTNANLVSYSSFVIRQHCKSYNFTLRLNSEHGYPQGSLTRHPHSYVSSLSDAVFPY